MARSQAVNWATGNIRRVVRRKARERWETMMANCEVTPKATRPIAKFLSKRGWPKAPFAVHGSLDLTFYPIDKANIIAGCLENQFRAHDLCDCDCDHRRHVEAQVEALLAVVDEDTPVIFRPCDVSKQIQSLKLGKARDFHGIPNECLRHLPRKPLLHLTHLFSHCLRLGHFPPP
jgi:hypothetical protein